MNRLLTIILAIGFGGCVASHQSVVTDVDVRGWESTISVEMTNSDTVTIRDIEIFARYIPHQIDDSIRIIINTISPDSTLYDEEMTIYFDTHTGDRSSSMIGRYPYRRHCVLRQMGSYKVEITPTDVVSGVEAIGINIERTQIEP